MDYVSKLSRLQYLHGLVEQYIPVMHKSGEDTRRLHREICEVYGEVSDVFEEVVGHQRIEVPLDRSSASSVYPNLFEAGFLSGRSIHSHQGRTELLKVIGQVKRRAEVPDQKSENRTANRPSASERVFLVHGHDEAMLQACARFLEKLGLPVTILREQSNQGRTVIEKFVHNSDVAFAVVLLTADDRGGPAGLPYENQQPRARQNVILELGFFLGRLGRERVCALYGEGVEVPSDYQGVAFVRLDSGMAWRLELARELQAVGLPVDLNKVV
jgi:predicted nucleotide-binding protein